MLLVWPKKPNPLSVSFSFCFVFLFSSLLPKALVFSDVYKQQIHRAGTKKGWLESKGDLPIT